MRQGRDIELEVVCSAIKEPYTGHLAQFCQGTRGMVDRVQRTPMAFSNVAHLFLSITIKEECQAGIIALPS